MNDKQIDFLDEYKQLCIKHKMQILGFDDGAYIIDLTDEEYELEALVFDDNHNLHFASKDELENSIADLKIYRQSTKGYKI